MGLSAAATAERHPKGEQDLEAPFGSVDKPQLLVRKKKAAGWSRQRQKKPCAAAVL